MAKFSTGDTRTEEVAGQAASADYSKEIQVGQYEYVGIQAVFSSLNAADGEIKIQGSVDGTNFDDYPDSGFYIPSGTSTRWWDINTRSLEKIKVVWAHGSNTAGTLGLVSRKEVPA